MNNPTTVTLVSFTDNSPQSFFISYYSCFSVIKKNYFISHFSKGVKKMEDEMVRLNPLNNIQVALNHRNLLYRVITFFLNLF